MSADSEALLSKRPPLLMLCVLISYPPVFGLIFTPALPNIATTFGIDSGTARLLVTAFMAGYACGQLIYGPLGNGLGRRKTVFFGVFLSLVGVGLCLISAMMASFQMMVVSVFVMALGACMGLTMAFTLIGDFFSPGEARKVTAYVMGSFSAVPGLTVFIGGLLTKNFGWLSCFYFLLAYGCAFLLIAARIPDVRDSYDIHNIKPKRIAHAYFEVLKDTRLIVYALMMGCGTVVIYGFMATGPLVAKTSLGLNPAEYGSWNFIVVFGVLCGYIIAAKTSARLSTNASLKVGWSLMLLASLAITLFYVFGEITILTTFVPVAIVNLGYAIIAPNTSAGATSSATDKASASAMLTFVFLAAAVVGVLILGLMKFHPFQLPGLLLCSSLGIAILDFMQKKG